MFQRQAYGVYVSSLLQTVPWLEHGFASRHAAAWPGEYSRVKQVHSAIVHVSDAPASPPDDSAAEGDALVTRIPARWIGIRTADCVPVLLADTRNRAVAAVHAGWRGTIADITSATLRKMSEVYRTDPGNIVAALGPCIGECCYEVGPEVARQFHADHESETLPSHVDLVEANLRQLLAAGVAPERIDVAGLCTMCEEEEFHSYRRDREASGRMVSAIRVLE
jgi:YfiH family protein